MDTLFGKIGAIAILVLTPIVWGVGVGWIFSALHKRCTVQPQEDSQL